MNRLYFIFYFLILIKTQAKHKNSYLNIFLNYSYRYIMVGYDPKKKDLENSQILIASMTSGFIARFILQPVDVIKIRLQVYLFLFYKNKLKYNKSYL